MPGPHLPAGSRRLVALHDSTHAVEVFTSSGCLLVSWSLQDARIPADDEGLARRGFGEGGNRRAVVADRDAPIGFLGFGEAGFHLARGLRRAGATPLVAFDIKAS